MVTSNVSPPHYSSLGIKYPENRENFLHTKDSWLEDKRAVEGAEGLWRIHDNLYDFTNFVSSHPGGSDWLTWTKGTDITEAFESHHVSTLAESILPKYYVRSAKCPRSSPFTFHETGFYRTLKNRVRETINDVPPELNVRSKAIADLLMLSYISTALIANLYRSYLTGFVSGLLLTFLTIAAHNFFHQRDNFRMYYFDFSLMSSKEWRISHVMSHHLYTNTILDLEISSLEPFLMYLPEEKHIVRSIISLIISPGFYVFMCPMSFFYRAISSYNNKISRLSKTDLLPFAVLGTMYMSSGLFLSSFVMWCWIACVGSFHFGLIAINAGHHHPKIFHDGDTIRQDLDWGLAQLDAVMDRKEVGESLFLVLTNFGEHTLHHLFPALDHARLRYFRPALVLTCREFGVPFRISTQYKLTIGQFRQLFNNKPNPLPPMSYKK